MIKVNWPLNTSYTDEEVCNWLDELVQQDNTIPVFETAERSTVLYFHREEDAIAFKLRFGL